MAITCNIATLFQHKPSCICYTMNTLSTRATKYGYNNNSIIENRSTNNRNINNRNKNNIIARSTNFAINSLQLQNELFEFKSFKFKFLSFNPNNVYASYSYMFRQIFVIANCIRYIMNTSDIYRIIWNVYAHIYLYNIYLYLYNIQTIRNCKLHDRWAIELSTYNAI